MSARPALDAWLTAELDRLKQADLLRVDRIVPRGMRVLCSNDYLGLSTHPALARAAAAAALSTGSGSGASRLVTGTLGAHHALERHIGRWLNPDAPPAVLLFNNGFSANTGVLSALLQPGDAVFSDALNHASLIDGMRLGRAERHVFAHQDFDALERQLKACTAPGRRWIVTESIFSMDGDATDLGRLCELAERAGADLIVDEAHAFGVVGPAGRGVAAAQGVADRIAVRIGTCGKALGSYGAFVVSSPPMRAWLCNRARSFVFSTALPPSVLAATQAGVDIVEQGVAQAELWRRIDAMRSGLEAAGWWHGPASSAIFPLVVGESGPTMALSAALARRGWQVSGIRPPTVPAGTARLRVTVTAGLPIDAPAEFVDALQSAARETGIAPSPATHGRTEFPTPPVGP